jgi:hypothetical protein
MGVVQDRLEKEGEFAARLGAFRSLFGSLEGGIEVGYLALGRASSPFCGESGSLPCEFEGSLLNSIDLVSSFRWRAQVGPVRPYVAAGAGVFGVKGGKYSDDALLREIRGGISTAIGIHLAKGPGIGAEARWLAILGNTGHRWSRNTDVLLLMVGLNLD